MYISNDIATKYNKYTNTQSNGTNRTTSRAHEELTGRVKSDNGRAGAKVWSHRQKHWACCCHGIVIVVVVVAALLVAAAVPGCR